MKILKVIHGYPPLFNAGSEVYSQTICHALADRHEVQVFTREEDQFRRDYAYRQALDALDPRVLLHLVNSPSQRLHERYAHPQIDARFRQVVEEFQPDLIHIGHLNHLSTGIVDIAHQLDVPMVYTLHDYWLMCPRGQFVQRNSAEPWALCDGQVDRRCAEECYSCRFSGLPGERERDLDYQTKWVATRMQHMRELCAKIDLFHAPSRYLMQRYLSEFGLSQERTSYLDYGFDLARLGGRSRTKGELPTFGYIGTHIPAKGIHHLLEAFAGVRGEAQLRIWGRPRAATATLEAMATGDPRVEWRAEYSNQNIVRDVFDHVDAIVVPSIWMENSPLVIHEALQAGVPVITADAGGMREYVSHEVNGLLFEHRNPDALREQMQRMVDRPFSMQGRYPQSPSGDVISVEEHCQELEKLYSKAVQARGRNVAKKPGPWRITFDTNPDHCNFACVMCECFSPHSDVREKRVKGGIKPRVMPIETIRKVLREAEGTPLREIIPSTMGEPLLYKQFEEIIALCHAHRVKLNLTTNGSFPIKGAKEWAELIVPVGSDVKISWNGATKKTHEGIMMHSRWDEVTANLETFIAVRDAHAAAGGNRCRVTLQLTFLQSNVHELADIVRLAIDYGVDRVKGHHLWAHFDEIQDLSMRRSPQAIREWNQAAREAIEVAEGRVLLENIYELNEDASNDLAPGGPCPFLGQEAWVNTAGNFSPCCAPDEQRKALGSFGNLNEMSMEQIWLSPAYQRLRRDYRSHRLCVGCNMRKPLARCD